MKHILMIATGGTIASKATADGLTPQLTSEELLAEVPELEQLCRIDTVQLMNRDSTNINSRDWLQMAACVRTMMRMTALSSRTARTRWPTRRRRCRT